MTIKDLRNGSALLGGIFIFCCLFFWFGYWLESIKNKKKNSNKILARYKKIANLLDFSTKGTVKERIEEELRLYKESRPFINRANSMVVNSGELKRPAIFIECDCYSHFLRVEVDDEYNIVFLSMLGFYNQQEKLSILDRIRLVFQILRNGRVYKDQLVLSFDKVKSFCQWLLKSIEEES